MIWSILVVILLAILFGVGCLARIASRADDELDQMSEKYQ